MSNEAERTPDLPIGIGCPVWNCEHWTDIVYPASARKTDRLRWYSKMFNVVEGNNSFYGIPEENHARRWCRETVEGFQFCMKFPREISHDYALVGARVPTDAFLRVLYVLAEHGRCGPAFLQLGPDFGPDRLQALERYLKSLPTDLDWAVEVRHPDWFDSDRNEAQLLELLRGLGINQTLFDSRALFQRAADDRIEQESQRRKPRSPLRRNVTGKQPMLRIVGRNRLELVSAFIEDWVPTLAKWLQQGLRPIVFTHAPDDRYAPEFARRFWERLATDSNISAQFGAVTPLPTLPAQPKQLGFQFE